MTISLANAICGLAQSLEHTQPGPSYGTVNIFLGNQNGLVAVTDSMLTFPASNEHKPIGAKLFKIDGRTVCTMAGTYDIPGPQNQTRLEFLVPQVMSDFLTRVVARDTFEEKAGFMARFFAFRLTALLQNLTSGGGGIGNLEPLYLTLAGYDVDGSLKIAEISFRASSDYKGVEAVTFSRQIKSTDPFLACKLTAAFPQVSPRSRESNLVLRKINNSFFCETVGLDGVAQDILANPAKYKGLNGIAAYLSFRNDGPPLSIEQLQALATTIAEETRRVESRNRKFGVGGSPQIAVLADGAIRSLESKSSAIPPSADVGIGLDSSQVDGFFRDCKDPTQGGILIVQRPSSMALMREHLVNCDQLLDGYNFHNSIFEQSHLSLRQAGDFLFDSSNVVVGSTLTLDEHITLDLPEIRKLVCNFHWKSVLQNGAEVVLSCPVQ